MANFWTRLSLKTKIVIFSIAFFLLAVLVIFFRERARIIAKFKFLMEKKLKEEKIKELDVKIQAIDKKLTSIDQEKAEVREELKDLFERKKKLVEMRKKYEDDLVDLASKLGY